MIGIIDHFDSFTYNIVMLVEALGEEVVVIDHHAPLEVCLEQDVRAWILGPGPGAPADTGVSRHLIGRAPTLGICLGHQLIGEFFGGCVVRASRPYHGIRMPIYHEGSALFEGIPSGFLGVRYHSLVVTALPEILQVTAWTEEGEVMALAHRTAPIFGVQFHPDSLATEYGQQLIANFLQTEIVAEVKIAGEGIVDKLGEGS